MSSAISSAVCHLFSAPSMEDSSIFQPCGKNAPKIREVIRATYAAVRGGDGGVNLGDRFLAAASASPAREAVIVAGEEPGRLTYGELRDRAWRVAGALHARGVRPKDRVGVLLGNGNEHLEVLIASFLLRAVP